MQLLQKCKQMMIMIGKILFCFRYFQDRRFAQIGEIVGSKKEPTGHELRQTEPFIASVLQKGHFKENTSFAKIGISIFASVSHLLDNFDTVDNFKR